MSKAKPVGMREELMHVTEQSISTSFTSYETKFEHYTHVVMSENGRLIEVPLRRGKDDAAFIDQISFTFQEDTLQEIANKPLLYELDYMEVLSKELERIFGFGIWKKAKTSGNRFYKHCYLLGTEEVLYGKIHFGGKSQNGSVCVEITGAGCKAALDGWEKRLKTFLDDAIKPRITRVDLTIDFLNGEFNLDFFEKAYLNGGFSWTNRNPKMSKVGSDWNAFNEQGEQLFEVGSGRTLYIGSRNCAKYVRIYEKGKQLGDKSRIGYVLKSSLEIVMY
ncbi:replication initiation factor domain-containing protein [Kingella negevensis]|uniref:replication initiation factor domain-containing protein n=1 Tax=Kingella negevensis TaxID=1522312 RepID=UPI0025435EF7|nr:replication initiation factor domain-containing protein [Kingella negevensis]WII93500.1 replication initiation factor domain-containing protein [Kingella negevensis]